MLSAANFPFIFKKYKTFQLDLLSQYQRGSRYLVRNLTFSGPVLCSQHSPVIIPVASLEVSSLELVERVRDAVSSTEQHTNTALLTSTPRRLSGCLDPVLCPRVRSSPQPDADVQPLDRLHNGQEEVEGKA